MELKKADGGRKILIISHNAMDLSSNNGRTLMEFFGGCEPANIAQLFLHKDKPTAEFCDNYYMITDFDIKESLFRFREAGRRVERNRSPEMTESEQNVYNIGSRRNSAVVFARNFAWGLNTWFGKKLKEWLKNFNPDVVFYMGGGYIFSIKLALKIASYLDRPLISFWGDDYYLNRAMDRGFLGKWNAARYGKFFKKIIFKSEYVCLDELMQTDYEKTFGKKGHTIYTASGLEPFEDKPAGDKLVMSFLGNISINRYKSLIDIAEVIRERELPIEFSLYTAETRSWILDNVLNVPGLNYKGKIAYDEVKKVMRDSDILVHAEDFSPQSAAEVKYSFSTKIADSLASNRCLFAYGPPEVASVKYLADNKCAVIAGSKEEIAERLTELTENKELLRRFAAKGRAVAELNHNCAKNYEKLGVIIDKVCNESIADK